MRPQEPIRRRGVAAAKWRRTIVEPGGERPPAEGSLRLDQQPDPHSESLRIDVLVRELRKTTTQLVSDHQVLRMQCRVSFTLAIVCFATGFAVIASGVVLLAL